MLQKIILSATFSLLVLCSIAQNGATYFIHKVRNGESFRSIAARYNLTAQKLADYNNLDFYEGDLAAKTLRIPRKFTKDDSKEKVPPASQDNADKALKENPPTTSLPGNTVDTSPVPTVIDTQSSTPPIVIGDTATQEINDEIEQPTLKSDISKHLRLILFLSVSFLLLAGAITYYKYVNRK